MTWTGQLLGVLLAVATAGAAAAPGEVPRPPAGITVVGIEFEAAGDAAESGPRAAELARDFFDQLRALDVATVVALAPPADARGEGLRAQAERAATQRHAQLALWGRVWLDPDGTPLVGVRLLLLEPPSTVAAVYPASAGTASPAPPAVIEVPAAPRRLDFSTVESDLSPVVLFVSGLLRYCRGAALAGAEAVPWLEQSMHDFRAYLDVISEKVDRGALSQAHFYLALAGLRLAEAEPARAAQHLRAARQEADAAADLHPYDPILPTLQAVIAARTGAPYATLRAHLVRAVRLAPADATAHLQLAALDGAEGHVGAAVQELDNADFVRKARNEPPLPAAEALRRQLAGGGR